ncbi:hypothetical protein [Achromobacter xylosoxidans]|uniref:hypothetical protein n=1 Tax=Alcaligenes xylosoxydans xylosoxydans TaxID=85698 RepID=UPI0034D71D0D
MALLDRAADAARWKHDEPLLNIAAHSLPELRPWAISSLDVLGKNGAFMIFYELLLDIGVHAGLCTKKEGSTRR